MKKETQEISPPNFELEPDDNTIAYCSTCKKVVFRGNNTTHVGNFILKSQVLGHINWFNEKHVVDVIQPRRVPHKITDGEYFVSAPWSTSKHTKGKLI